MTKRISYYIQHETRTAIFISINLSISKQSNYKLTINQRFRVYERLYKDVSITLGTIATCWKDSDHLYNTTLHVLKYELQIPLARTKNCGYKYMEIGTSCLLLPCKRRTVLNFTTVVFEWVDMLRKTW